MNKPFPSQNSINFAALSFAIQYYKDEQHLMHGFKYGVLPDSNTPIAGHQIVRDWIAHFAVARSFTGFGQQSLDERERSYGKIYDVMSSWHGRQSDGESMVERVLRVESVLRTELKIRTSLLSATSKLLWLVDRESIIYDGIVRKKLGTVEGDYVAYCEKWEASFRTMASGIEAATTMVGASSHLLPEKWDLKRDCMRPWFLRRVFDTLHWND